MAEAPDAEMEADESEYDLADAPEAATVAAAAAAPAATDEAPPEAAPAAVPLAVAVATPGISQRDAEQPCKLFIGGLDWSTTDESLKTFFLKYGPMTDVIVMKDNNSGPVPRSRGFGFVTYTSESAAEAALADKPHMLDGKQIEAKKAVARGQQAPARTDLGGRQTPRERDGERKIFVGGLSSETDDASFKAYFGAFGTISDCIVMKDSNSGHSRCVRYNPLSPPRGIW